MNDVITIQKKDLVKVVTDVVGPEFDELRRERERWKGQFEQLADDALIALAGAVATPEETYKKAPHCLRGDIMRLRQDRDRLQTQLTQAEKARDELVGLVKAAACPNKCSNGVILRQAYGGDDQEQCQWCDVRATLLARIDAKGE